VTHIPTDRWVYRQTDTTFSLKSFENQHSRNFPKIILGTFVEKSHEAKTLCLSTQLASWSDCNQKLIEASPSPHVTYSVKTLRIEQVKSSCMFSELSFYQHASPDLDELKRPCTAKMSCTGYQQQYIFRNTANAMTMSEIWEKTAFMAYSTSFDRYKIEH